jgi:hypothetical protein
MARELNALAPDTSLDPHTMELVTRTSTAAPSSSSSSRG